ncbi:MAG: PKD domain-containing protein [Thermoplasmata archaeon]
MKISLYPVMLNMNGPKLSQKIVSFMIMSCISLSLVLISSLVVAENPNEPVAALTVSKTTVYTNEIVQLDASTSYLTNGSIAKYQFVFDDGNDTGWITTPSTTHQYTTSGTYRVQLRVEGNNEKTSSWDTKQIVVLNQLPSISITSPTNQSTVSGIVSIEGTARDSDGIIQSVDIEINGVWNQAKITDNTIGSWTYQWDTAQISGGMYYVFARAFDGLDYSTEVVLYLTVDNINLKTSIEISNYSNSISANPADAITVYGDAAYNTGNKTATATVTVKIQEYGNTWYGNTNSNGHFEIRITAPNITGSCNITIKVSDGYLYGQVTIPLSVIEKPLPDFGISESDIALDDEWNKSGIVTIYTSIHNYNAVDATTNVAFYDGDPDKGGTIIDTVSSVQVPQKSAATASTIWKGVAGVHDVWVVVDLGNWIIESNEQNNRAWKQITLIEKSDIEVENILFSNNAPNVGDSITITIKIANLLGIYTNTTLKIYDGDPLKNGTLAHSDKITVPPLGTTPTATLHVSSSTQTVYAILTDTTPKDVNGNNDVLSKELRPVSKEIERSNIPSVHIGYLFIIFIGVALALFIQKNREQKRR